MSDNSVPSTNPGDGNGHASPPDSSASSALSNLTLHGFSQNSVTVQPTAPARRPVSRLSPAPAIAFAQMVELEGGEGLILYYPKKGDFNVGDVLYLRERRRGENGVIVQVIEKGTARYPQADDKALFRLMASVRAAQIQRTHHEPPETIDEFLSLRFKVRAAIVKGKWTAREGRVVTRNVDIFRISPAFLMKQVVHHHPTLSLHLGDYKGKPLNVYGGGFEKVNLITGMKGGGKSHIAKGIIAESLKLGMSALVFETNENDNYASISPNGLGVVPGDNLKFRLDFMETESLFRMIERLSPFADKTAYAAYSMLPKLIQARKQPQAGIIPDLAYLKTCVKQVIPGNDNSEAVRNMRYAYERSITNLENHNLIMTEAEAIAEDQAIRQRQGAPVVSLRSVFANMFNGQPQVVVFRIGGMESTVQRVVVALVLDHLKTTCNRQTQEYKNGNIPMPIYPTVYFEEAHMYMDGRDIDELIPVIRHIGINVFFITNTPEALPNSVFRLMDNLILTRLVNRKDILRVTDCGLTDQETIEQFAENMQDYHTLLLGAKNGATNNFPLVFHVRDFYLPPSGQTRSQWEVMKAQHTAAASRPRKRRLLVHCTSSLRRAWRRKPGTPRRSYP